MPIMNFHMINERVITICTDKEEHDRVMDVLDKFRPDQKDKNGYLPCRPEGIMFVQNVLGPAHMVNLETFVDLIVEY